MKGAKGPRKRLILVLAAGIVALLCLGGGGIAFVLYDQETRIDRGSPDLAVDNYLRAYLANRDDERAKLLTCDGRPATSEMAALRSDVESRERQHTMTVSFSWSSLQVQSGGDDRATVQTEVERAVSDGTEALSDRWSFSVEDRDGWRVCSATKLP